MTGHKLVYVLNEMGIWTVVAMAAGIDIQERVLSGIQLGAGGRGLEGLDG